MAKLSNWLFKPRTPKVSTPPENSAAYLVTKALNTPLDPSSIVNAQQMQDIRRAIERDLGPAKSS